MIATRIPAALLLAITLIAGAGAESTAKATEDGTPAMIVSVDRGGYSISGLLQTGGGGHAFRYGIALFPGHPGIMRLRDEGGRITFSLGGNFLVRSRQHWLDDETLVLVVDAPSDVWGTFSQVFRESPRYGSDVAALLTEVSRRYPVEQWTFVGTSEGSVSAFHAARMNPDLAKHLILSASVFVWGKNGPGLSDVSFGALGMPLLWVHHLDDPCPHTRYADALLFATKSKSPLLTIRGANGVRGDPCQAFTQHGFVGMERGTVEAMRLWTRTGRISPPSHGN